MAYTQRHTWNTGDPITQEKMTEIEAGIFDAARIADTAAGNITTINSNIGDKNQLNSEKINNRSNLVAAINDVADTASRAESSLS